jgi:hypothetical protein
VRSRRPTSSSMPSASKQIAHRSASTEDAEQNTAVDKFGLELAQHANMRSSAGKSSKPYTAANTTIAKRGACILVDIADTEKASRQVLA